MTPSTIDRGPARRGARRPGLRRGLGGLVLLAAASQAAQATTITIVNNDGANEGFNDPTAYTPTGGNPATTVGQARLNVFNRAAAIWAAKLSSSVPILVDSQFNPLTCSTNSAVLGQAGATNFGRLPNDAYLSPVALLSARNGSDVDPSQSDITAVFNSNLGQPGCLPSNSFYYGLDHKANAARGQIDFLAVVTHEFGHGLGFISLVNPSTGASQDTSGGYVAAFDSVLYDETTGQTWNKDTAAQRKAIAVSKSNLTFSGTNTVAAAAAYLTAGRNAAGRPLMYAPSTVATGSSVSHWDTSATPNLLMEPNYNTDTPNLDLTPCAMKDIGWTLPTAACLDTGNVAPVATAQAVSTTKNKAVAVTLSATDANNDALSYTVVTPPAHGTLSGTAPGLTYTPATAYTGTDSFTFQASDGQATSNTATVTLSISNQAPTANGQSLNATLGQALSIVLTGSDPDGDALTYTVLTQPALGTLTGTAPTLTYTPNTAGTDAFTFRVTDSSGASSAPQTVTLTNAAAGSGAGTGTASAGTTAAAKGGGATPPGLLLGLAALALGRRRRLRA